MFLSSLDDVGAPADGQPRNEIAAAAANNLLNDETMDWTLRIER